MYPQRYAQVVVRSGRIALELEPRQRNVGAEVVGRLLQHCPVVALCLAACAAPLGLSAQPVQVVDAARLCGGAWLALRCYRRGGAHAGGTAGLTGCGLRRRCGQGRTFTRGRRGARGGPCRGLVPGRRARRPTSRHRERRRVTRRALPRHSAGQGQQQHRAQHEGRERHVQEQDAEATRQAPPRSFSHCSGV